MIGSALDSEFVRPLDLQNDLEGILCGPRWWRVSRPALRVTSKALPSHNRQHNRSLLLQTLFHEGAMSRADLARSSGLTRVTVSDLVNDFSSEGLISDLGERVGAGVGQPGRVISFCG